MRARGALAALAALCLASPAVATTLCGPAGCAAAPTTDRWFTVPDRGADSGAATRPTDNLCLCYRVYASAPMAEVNSIIYDVKDVDADDVVRYALYTHDGGVRVVSATLVVTGGNQVITANAETVMPVPAGFYWQCLSLDETTAAWNLTSARGSAGGNDVRRHVKHTATCTNGALPATLTPTPAAATEDPPLILLTDDP